jgi:hypothetical protein
MSFEITQADLTAASTNTGNGSSIMPGKYAFTVANISYGKDNYENDRFEFSAILIENAKEIKFGTMRVNKKDGSPNLITRNTVIGWMKQLKLTDWNPKKSASVFNGCTAVAEFVLNDKGYLSFKWITFDKPEPIKYAEANASFSSDDVPF